MKVAVRTVSYDADLEWLKFQKKSFDKYCSGYDSYAVISYPEENKLLSKWLNSESITHFINNSCPKIKRGYMKQQWIKMTADLFSNNSDYIMHIDSDCVFHTNNTPETFFINNKPIMLMTPYDGPSLKNAGVPWQAITEKAFGRKVDFEFMRRMPLIYPTNIYKDLRDWFDENRDFSLLGYIEDGNDLSEFNLMGAYCWEYHRDKFHWINTEKEGVPDSYLEQFWSYGGVLKNLEKIKSHTDRD